MCVRVRVRGRVPRKREAIRPVSQPKARRGASGREGHSRTYVPPACDCRRARAAEHKAHADASVQNSFPDQPAGPTNPPKENELPLRPFRPLRPPGRPPRLGWRYSADCMADCMVQNGEREGSKAGKRRPSSATQLPFLSSCFQYFHIDLLPLTKKWCNIMGGGRWCSGGGRRVPVEGAVLCWAGPRTRVGVGVRDCGMVRSGPAKHIPTPSFQTRKHNLDCGKRRKKSGGKSWRPASPV